jgi:hypothetical protein
MYHQHQQHRRRRMALARAVCVAALAAAAVAVFGGRNAGADSSSAPCPSGAVDIGTYCLSASLQTVNGASTADYFTATRTCASQGGYLPTADELIGAANRVKLAGRLDDSPTDATIDQDPSDGLTDWREMSSTLVTTQSGSDAAGTLGVSPEATGNPATGEPNPTPEPADTAPASLQYVTVIANGGMGGFAGSEPVSTPERFRCAFNAQSPAYVPPPPVVTPHAPRLAAAASISLSALAQRGIATSVTCAAACTYRVALEMSATDARRLGLKAGAKAPATLANSSRRTDKLGGGSIVHVTLKPSPGMVANLRYWLTRLRMRTVKATLVLTVQQTPAKKAITSSRTLALKR